MNTDGAHLPSLQNVLGDALSSTTRKPSDTEELPEQAGTAFTECPSAPPRTGDASSCLTRWNGDIEDKQVSGLSTTVRREFVE